MHTFFYLSENSFMTFILKKNLRITPETFVPKFVQEGLIKGCSMKDA